MNLKKVIVISTSLRRGSNSDRLAGTLFCGGVNAPGEIEGNVKLQEAFEMGKHV